MKLSIHTNLSFKNKVYSELEIDNKVLLLLFSDPSRGKGTVVQLRRPATTSTWSSTRGSPQAQRGKRIVGMCLVKNQATMELLLLPDILSNGFNLTVLHGLLLSFCVFKILISFSKSFLLEGRKS